MQKDNEMTAPLPQSAHTGHSSLPRAQNDAIAQLMRVDYAPQDLDAIETFLKAHGTLALKIKPNGLYAAVTTDEAHLASGYSYTWVRDTVAVCVYHIETSHADIAARAAQTLQDYFTKHRRRLDGIIDGSADKDDAMQRPHIRFDGDTLEEIDQQWGHAQNDALGYALWLAGTLARSGHFEMDAQLWALFAQYFDAVNYWQDADNGHWEEARKIESSSIGAAMAGLCAFKNHMTACKISDIATAHGTVTPAFLEALIAKGQAQLDAFLPWETKAGLTGARRADAATLFLAYPLNVASAAQTAQILETVTSELQGSYGIKRYLGDSYWCANYKKIVSASGLTADFSGTQEERDRLLIPGTEAQWCIFDPIISAIYARRFLASGAPADLQMQIFHFNRALSHITPSGQCPEAYYMADSATGVYVPNDQTPLAWTQANLGIALAYMRRTRGGDEFLFKNNAL